MRYESRTLPNVHNKPSASKIHPTQLRGRLEATSAPTRGKARKGKKLNTLPTAPRVFHSPGESIDRASTCKAMAATNMITERAASDQASQAAVRVLIPPVPRSCCCHAPSVTTPLYTTTVPRTLRGINFWTDFVHATLAYGWHTKAPGSSLGASRSRELPLSIANIESRR